MANEKQQSNRQAAILACIALLAALLLSRFGLGLAGPWLRHFWAFQVLGAPLLHILAERLHAYQVEQIIRLWRAGLIFARSGTQFGPPISAALAFWFTSAPANLRRLSHAAQLENHHEL